MWLLCTVVKKSAYGKTEISVQSAIEVLKQSSLKENEQLPKRKNVAAENKSWKSRNHNILQGKNVKSYLKSSTTIISYVNFESDRLFFSKNSTHSSSMIGKRCSSSFAGMITESDKEARSNIDGSLRFVSEWRS
uniref:Uncharacterized protein n=1 Tax=Romanomermis culicivorax TaxID=13658 RepID=A0A915IUG3_ROMCU